MTHNSTSMSPARRFWQLLKPDRKEISNVYVYGIFNGLVYLSLPLGIQAIVNLIQGGQVSTSWIVLIFFVVLGVTITGVLRILQMRITENLQQKIFSRAAFEFTYRIPRIRMEALYRHYAPELMNRFFDIVSVQKGLPKIIIDFSTAVFNAGFGLILLSFYHSFFILFGLILILLIYVLFRLTAGKGLRTSLEESRHKYRVASWLEELARMGTTFKLAGITDLPLRRTDRHVDDYLKARGKHFSILIRQYSLMVLFKVLVTTGLLAVGGILVMQQQMNIGQFVAAEIIILMVMSSVEKVFLSLEVIYDVLTALEKIGQVTDMGLDQKEGAQLIKEGERSGIRVDLREVSFAYPEGSRRVLDRLTISVKSGEKVVVAGPNGSGKSTLLQVMAGLYDAQQGAILYDGLSCGSLDVTALRSIMGDYLAQEELFEGTILENITMGRTGISTGQVKWALESMGLERSIHHLPKGLDTVVDPGGKKMPRSTAQKLLLARSIVHWPRLLLLEDALEHIEKKEQRRIIDFLTSRHRPWTMVAVSSNPYLAQQADQVIIMDKGRIIESGAYPVLIDRTHSIKESHA